MTPDRTTLAADGQDLSYVTVEILDKKGNLCPMADNLVEFEVTGAGILKAVGNGNAATTDSFQASERSAFSGKCMAIIQSSKLESGNIEIKASSKGLKATKTIIGTQSL